MVDTIPPTLPLYHSSSHPAVAFSQINPCTRPLPCAIKSGRDMSFLRKDVSASFRVGRNSFLAAAPGGGGGSKSGSRGPSFLVVPPEAAAAAAVAAAGGAGAGDGFEALPAMALARALDQVP